MTHAEIIEHIAHDSGVKRKDVRKALNSWSKICACELSHGGKVTISGIGVLKTVKRDERAGRNPKTGEDVTISARTVFKIAPSKLIKEILNP